MLPAFESDIFAALRHHTGRTGATADDRSDCRAFAAAGDRADDGADTGRGTDFGRVVFGRVTSFDASFGIDFRLIHLAQRSNFYKLSMKCRGAIVSRTDLIEGELQFRNAFNFARASYL